MKYKKTSVLISTADMSAPNGQGIYSRKVLSLLAHEIVSEGGRPIVITPKPVVDELIYNEFPPDTEWLLSKAKENRSFKWHFGFQVFVLINIIRKRPKSVIFSVKPSMFTIEMARILLNFDKIILVEGNGVKNLKTLGGWFVNLLGNISYRLCFRNAKLIVPAYHSAELWVRGLDKNAKILNIPCGIDPIIFNDASKFEKRYSRNHIKIGYVGSFRKVHMLDNLLFLVEKYPNVNLILVGSGEQFESIYTRVKQKKLLDRVTFTGAITQNRVPQFLSMCDILWAVTDVNHWGVPIKAYEYLSCNRFVIVSSREEFKFIDINSFGITLSSNSQLELDTKFRELVTSADFENLIDIESRNYILKNHNWNNFKLISNYFLK